MIQLLDLLSLTMLAVAGLGAVARVVRPGSLPDKVLGADTAILVVACAVSVTAGLRDDRTLLDVLAVITLLGFIGTITVARYVEQRGARS